MGSYAIEPITAGESVAAFGGWVADEAELRSLPAERISRTMQIDEHLYLVSGETADPGDYVNHSCTPNCGLAGNMLVVAMRDIAIGEELTFDYAMSDGGGAFPTCSPVMRVGSLHIWHEKSQSNQKDSND